MLNPLTGTSLTKNRAYGVGLERRTVVDHSLDDILLTITLIAMLFCIRQAFDDRIGRSFEDQMISASTESWANRIA